MSQRIHTAVGQFTVEMSPGDSLLRSTSRLDLTKTWTGAISGTSTGVMITGGDPGTGTAGYVAFEAFDGEIDSRRGHILFQQFGTMNSGTYILRYEIVPGSGTDELSGMTGVITLTIRDGNHHVILEYEG